MRLDRYLVASGLCTRSQAGKLIRAGKVTVNGVTQRKADSAVREENDTVVFCGETVVYRKYTYIKLNKPAGYVSATEDGHDPTVLELLPETLRRIGLFPCGRLDKNTLGLMLLTNNGELAHRLLAPKRHVDKSYVFHAANPVTEEDRTRLEAGVDIGGYVTAPCRVEMTALSEGVITIHEGKYHQIKLMLAATGNKITYLKRVTFGPLVLDGTLDRGMYRYLTEEEVAAIESLG